MVCEGLQAPTTSGCLCHRNGSENLLQKNRDLLDGTAGSWDTQVRCTSFGHQWLLSALFQLPRSKNYKRPLLFVGRPRRHVIPWILL